VPVAGYQSFHILSSAQRRERGESANDGTNGQAYSGGTDRGSFDSAIDVYSRYIVGIKKWLDRYHYRNHQGIDAKPVMVYEKTQLKLAA